MKSRAARFESPAAGAFEVISTRGETQTEQQLGADTTRWTRDLAKDVAIFVDSARRARSREESAARAEGPF